MQKKHMRSFWPLTIIFFLAVIVAGLVIWFAYNNTLLDEINSLAPGYHAGIKKPPAKTTPAKTTPAKK